MHHRKRNFLKILKIEMDDLKEDIVYLINTAEEEKQNGDISNYVFLGNLAVLKTELLGVDTFEDMLSTVNPDDYESLQQMVDHLQNKVKEEIGRKGLPEAISNLVNRKIAKVADYVEHTASKV